MLWIVLIIAAFFVYFKLNTSGLIYFGLAVVIFCGVLNGGELTYSFTSHQSFLSEYFGNYVVVKYSIVILTIFYLAPIVNRLQGEEWYALLILSVMPLYLSAASIAGFTGLSGGIFESFTFFCELIYVFVVYSLAKEKSELDKLIFILLLCFIVIITINAAGFIFSPEKSLRASRLRGVSGSANWLAAYLCFISVFIFCLYDSSVKKVTIVGALLVAFVLLLATASRTALVAFLVSMFYCGIRKGSVGNKVLIPSLVGMSLLLLLPFIEISSDINIERLFSVENTRASVWEHGINVFYEHADFLFGTGRGGDAVESVFVSMLIVYGTLGLGILILVSLYLVYIIFRRWDSKYNKIGSTLVLSYLIVSFFESIYFGKAASFNVFLYLGVFLSVHRNYAMIPKSV